MPKRTDIKSILIIGAGPIVIGQACEFDYSGTQACKALKAEGYRIVLVNSNPATIMTDPELADATYIEPITPEIVAKIIEKRAARRPAADHGRADGAQHGARRSTSTGVLAKFGVEMIGAKAPAIDKAEDRQLFREAMTQHRPRDAASRCSRTTAPRRWPRWSTSGLPAIIRPSFTLGGTGGGIAYNREEFAEIVERGLDASPDAPGAGRGERARLEGVRDGGGPRQGGQLHHRLLHREHRSRWACTRATRSPWRRR